MNTKIFDCNMSLQDIMKSKHYYKMSKYDFVDLYILTKDDEKCIKDTIKICEGRMSERTAKNLLLHKIYEDSRFLNKDYDRNVNRMLEYIDKSHKKMGNINL